MSIGEPNSVNVHLLKLTDELPYITSLILCKGLGVDRDYSLVTVDSRIAMYDSCLIKPLLSLLIECELYFVE